VQAESRPCANIYTPQSNAKTKQTVHFTANRMAILS
jgi:hypothetical protein